MDTLLLESFEIVKKAITDYKPYAVVLMLSGGDDSVLALHVCKELDIKVDFIIHGITGTGIKEATDFARKIGGGVLNSKYLEANAGDAYENYVLRKGFFGKGTDAHTLSYHVLKAQPFRTAVSHNIRHAKKNRPVLFLNGVRVDESENRADNLGDNPYNRDPAAPQNIWVNIVHWWTTKERDNYLSSNRCERNPVSICMGRSGECMCGTMQNMATGLEAAEKFPEWGKWWMDIRKRVMEKFPWDWSHGIGRMGSINIILPK